jgi:undecaprenyl diphosphate synthase
MQEIVHCIGLILDGNRRWAKERGLPSFEGHARGFENLKTIARAVHARGIPHVVVYAFSTENWNRSPEEVAYLMDIYRAVIRETGEQLGREGMRIRFVGQRDRFAQDMQESMRDTEEHTKANTATTLWVCLSYGGRAEIVEAARALSRAGAEITEQSLQDNLWTAEMPDPDILVRTGGEQRLSNFLLWQSAYSELFFIKQYWPDFDEAALDAVLAEYAERERRRGR